MIFILYNILNQLRGMLFISCYSYHVVLTTLFWVLIHVLNEQMICAIIPFHSRKRWTHSIITFNNTQIYYAKMLHAIHEQKILTLSYEKFNANMSIKNVDTDTIELNTGLHFSWESSLCANLVPWFLGNRTPRWIAIIQIHPNTSKHPKTIVANKMLIDSIIKIMFERLYQIILFLYAY